MFSVVLYIVLPVIVAQLVRRSLLASGGKAALDRLLKALGPVSLVALLATLVLLFGFQGEQIIAQPLVIALLAVVAARALLLQLRHEFGAHVGSSVVKFVKICWKLLHKSDHGSGHAA